MKLSVVYQPAAPASASPHRVSDEKGGEVEWANAFLDSQRLRQLSPRSLRSYAYDLLDFARWFEPQHRRLAEMTESTIVDYVRHQLEQDPKPTPQTVNHRLGTVRCCYRFHTGQEIPAGKVHFQRRYTQRSPLGYGRTRPAVAWGLRLKQDRRVILPLSSEEVAKFWQSFRTYRDLALVGLMLLDGLRSCEVLALQLEDLQLAEGQLRALGKGNKKRVVPLPPEILEVLGRYLRLERPLTNSPALFVSLKGRHRAQPMTSAGLRSLFRHHRVLSQVRRANPHRFRHTFGSDMVRAGMSLPALQHLMGHAQNWNYDALRPTRSARCLARIRSRHREAGSLGFLSNLMSPPRPSLEQILETHIQTLGLTLRPNTVAEYLYIGRRFFAYLRTAFPQVRRLSQLRRDPHLLSWFRALTEQQPPLGNATRFTYLIRLRRLLHNLTANSSFIQPDFIRREDFPVQPRYLPRPLSLQDDQLLQQELCRTDDLRANALLLIRATGIRIGECLDLSLDCLRQLEPDRWALHVPLGKLHTERLVPADPELRQIVKRILALRASAPPFYLAKSQRLLLPRRRRQTLEKALRSVLAQTAKRAGCFTHVTPHQLRHSFATEMLRLGVSLPALMQLLGHKDVRMTLRYVQVTQQDLQREFHQARQNAAHPHRLPTLALPKDIPSASLPTIYQALEATRHLLEMYRRQLGNEKSRRTLQRLDKRLLAVASQLQRVHTEEK